MQNLGIPNLSMAVVSGDGRLVLARGYTFCTPFPSASEILFAEPTSLYRIMSVSKPITAMALLKLWEQGRCELHDAASEYVDMTRVPPGMRPSATMQSITLFELLTHTGGLGSFTWGDPPGEVGNAHIAAQLGITYPVTLSNIISYVSALDPINRGSFFYANYGYNLLSRVVANISRMPFESFVQKRLFDPLHITNTHAGYSEKWSGRYPNEVRYYTGRNLMMSADYTSLNRSAVNTPYASSVLTSTTPDGLTYPGNAPTVEAAYGGFRVENFDGNGRWVSNVIDLAALFRDVRSGAESVLLDGSTIGMMLSPYVYDNVKSGSNVWYGLGWRTVGNGHWYHTGGNTGSRALVYMFPPTGSGPASGAVVTVLMNRRPEDLGTATMRNPWTDAVFATGAYPLGATLVNQLQAISNWGTASDDLWPQYLDRSRRAHPVPEPVKPEFDLDVDITAPDPDAVRFVNWGALFEHSWRRK